jgi:hypothetical protein
MPLALFNHEILVFPKAKQSGVRSVEAKTLAFG